MRGNLCKWQSHGLLCLLGSLVWQRKEGRSEPARRMTLKPNKWRNQSYIHLFKLNYYTLGHLKKKKKTFPQHKLFQPLCPGIQLGKTQLGIFAALKTARTSTTNLLLDWAQTGDKNKDETASMWMIFNRWINSTASITMTSPRYWISRETDRNYSPVPNFPVVCVQ